MTAAAGERSLSIISVVAVVAEHSVFSITLTAFNKLYVCCGFIYIHYVSSGFVFFFLNLSSLSYKLYDTVTSRNPQEARSYFQDSVGTCKGSFYHLLCELEIVNGSTNGKLWHVATWNHWRWKIWSVHFEIDGRGIRPSPLKKHVYMLCEVVSGLVDKQLTWLMVTGNGGRE